MAIRLGCLARPPYSHIPAQTSTVNRYLFPTSLWERVAPAMPLLQNKNLLAQIRDEEASVVPPRFANAGLSGYPLPIR